MNHLVVQCGSRGDVAVALSTDASGRTAIITSNRRHQCSVATYPLTTKSAITWRKILKRDRPSVSSAIAQMDS